MDLEIIHTTKEDTIQAIIFVRNGSTNIDAKLAVIFKKQDKEAICLEELHKNIDPVYPETNSTRLHRIEKGIYMATCPKSFNPEKILILISNDSTRTFKEIALH